MRKRGGFTLIELLMVVSIIALLMGIIVVIVMAALKRGKEHATRARIGAIENALEEYKTHFGAYPPTSLSQLKMGYSHGANSGNEALVMCLTSTLRGGEPFANFKDDELTNADNDTGNNITQSYIVSGQLFEVVDAWKHPFIYINSRDYAALASFAKYQGVEVEFTVLTAAMNKRTGAYENPSGFQLWSIGEDAVCDPNGEDTDDIVNWRE